MKITIDIPEGIQSNTWLLLLNPRKTANETRNMALEANIKFEGFCYPGDIQVLEVGTKPLFKITKGK